MKIRHASVQDAEKILDIYAPYVLETPISFETTVPNLKEFTDRITETTKKFPWLVCELDQQIVGYAYASTYKSRCAYEWSVESTVYVGKNYHGKGIGSKLYKELFPLLKFQGAVNVIAGITLPNVGSVRLHESLGFMPVGSFKDVGHKLNKWWDVGYWQLQLQKPLQPQPLIFASQKI